MKIYRYVQILEKTDANESVKHTLSISKKLMDTIQKSRLYFSHPADFNDPMECIIPVKYCDEEMIPSKERERILSAIEAFGEKERDSPRIRRLLEAMNYGIPIEQCLVKCFSRDENNPLLWAHYGDQHKGVCFGFELPDNWEDLKSQITWSNQVAYDMEHFGLFPLCGPVKYCKFRPALSVKSGIVQNDANVCEVIFTKPDYWEYEHEWRLALCFPFDGSRGFARGGNLCEYFVDIPKQWLKEITFGLRLDETYCEELIHAIEGNGYTDVKYWKCTLRHDVFSIERRPYKQGYSR